MLNTNNVYCGDCVELIKELENESIDLIVTSPPYFNAKSYSQYDSYESYLKFLEEVFTLAYKVLKCGRFCCVNLSCVIQPRECRRSESIRYPIPFHFVCIMERIGFKFLEDIIWEKPEGAVKNRNGGFFRNRKPLTWKPNVVNEYILVFQKKTDLLIDDLLKKYDKNVVEKSLISGTYERSNIWKIPTSNSKYHPAEFPISVPINLISYYSFIGDLVLDMFNGSGTTCVACKKLNRNYIGIDKEKDYVAICKSRLECLG